MSNKLREALDNGGWVPCVKLPVIVHVRKQRLGESHSSTREGITPVLPDDLIMRGVSSEEYPIGREIFEKTYELRTALAAVPTTQDCRTCRSYSTFVQSNGSQKEYCGKKYDCKNFSEYTANKITPLCEIT
jgi:hypothetical protein